MMEESIKIINSELNHGQNQEAISGRNQEPISGGSRETISEKSQETISGGSRETISGGSRESIPGQNRETISGQSREAGYDRNQAPDPIRKKEQKPERGSGRSPFGKAAAFPDYITKELKELRLINFLVLAAAGTINAFGVTVFLFPVKLYDSGISGLSMLLDQVTPVHWTLSLFLILLNVPIFLFGMKKQGFSFTVYSVFTIAVYSFVSFLIMNVFAREVAFISPLAGTDLLLCAVFGGVISGIGSGLTIRWGGAIDGIGTCSG